MSCSCWCCFVRDCSFLQLLCSFSLRGCILRLFRIFMRFFSEFWPRWTSCLRRCRAGLRSTKIWCILSGSLITCSVYFFFDIGCLQVEVRCLSALAELVALDAFDVCFGGFVPSFGQFVVGGCLFEHLDRLLRPLAFVADNVAEETSWMVP